MRHPEHGEEGPSGRLTPSQARRSLGVEMRGLREFAGLTLSEAAARIQRSAPTLSRLENGKSTPRLVDVKALLDQYAEASPDPMPSGIRERIVGLTTRGREEEWFSPFRDVISGDMTADDVQRYVEFESDATKIWSFEPELIPGLLQTRGYAEAVTELFFPARTAAQRTRFVEFRLARQHILTRPGVPVDFDVVIGEAALLRVVGMPEIMREQLNALRHNIENGQSNVQIRIAPVGLSTPAVVGGPFVVMDFDSADEPGLVYLEARGGSQYDQTPAELDRYRTLAHDMAKAVLDKDDSLVAVEEALDKLPR